MATKSKYYYFLNGNPAESNALCIPIGDTYIKNVKDIADIDIVTMELGTKLDEALKESNPNIELHGHNYIAKYPYSKDQIKIFKPIEIIKETATSIKIVNGFRELAEERQYKVIHGQKLEIEDKLKVDGLIDDILGQMTSGQKAKCFGENSIIGREVQKNYYDNAYLFRLKMASYTQLRCLLINYLYFLAGRDIPNNRQVYDMSKSINSINGLYYEEPADIKKALEEYKQKLIEAKNEEEKQRAARALNNKSNDGQMSILDFMPEAEEFFMDTKNKGRVKNQLND